MVTVRAGLLLAVLAASAGLQDPQPQQPQQPPRPTFRTGTNLVRVDVTVMDRRGEPVRTLTANDFEVMENGIPQPITSFKLLEATGQPTDDLSLPIRSPEHAAAEAARDDVRVFLIFWDEYHIGEFVSSLRAREQLTRFVLEAFGPTDLVAFMDPLTTLDSIRFTRDRRALAEQVHRLKGRRGVYVPARSVMEEGHLQNMRDIEGIRAQITVSALRGALLHLGSLREGRKSLILISESLGPLRDQTATVLSDLMRTANDTNTAIVTVDPRGLQVGRGPGVRPSDVLVSLAYGSGAEPITSNDFDGPLRRVVRQASAFYLLGYDAGNSPMDGKFHQIKVRLKREGLEVRARSGYWAPRATELARAKEAAAASALPPAIARAFAELPAETARRPADFWIGLSPGARDMCDVTIAWVPRGNVANRSAASVDVVAKVDAAEIHSGPIGPRGATFSAPAGTLVMTFSVRDAEGEIIDREVRTIEVPQPALATLALSTPVVFRARNPLELRALTEDSSPLVYAGRDFERSDRLRVRVKVYGTASEGAKVSARLLGAQGTALANLPVQTAGAPDLYQIDLVPSSISRGAFIIAIEATKDAERVERMVPFRVR
jgi:VWFA-related protein